MKYFLIILCSAAVFALPAHAARRSPVDSGTLTSSPGYRLDPFGSGRTLWHNGWDIAVPTGTPVYPTQDGTVYFAGPYKGYGYLVAVLHGKGYISLYGHNSEVLVKPGQVVDTKTIIARAGSTGRSTGPHVHYELRQLPAHSDRKQAELERSLRDLALGNVDEIVEEYVAGKGDGGEETLLPNDIDQ